MRTAPLLFALLLLMLQSAAPLLHVHAAEDPRDLAVEGLHLPGLEPVPTVDGTLDVVSERVYPLIEEAECCRQRLVPDAVTPGALPHPWPDAGRHDLPAHVFAGLHGATDCAPPPTRAPPESPPV